MPITETTPITPHSRPVSNAKSRAGSDTDRDWSIKQSVNISVQTLEKFSRNRLGEVLQRKLAYNRQGRMGGATLGANLSVMA